MANYQVLFSGDVNDDVAPEAVRANLARELGIDEKKTKQLFTGRTVVLRSQLTQEEAEAWQEKLGDLGAICRIKNFAAQKQEDDPGVRYRVDDKSADYTLKDITAAHMECPRCGHMQLLTKHCARCGVDLEEAQKQKRKEDLLIEKKIRDLRNKQQTAPVRTPIRAEPAEHSDRRTAGSKLGKISSWLKRG